MWNKEFYSSRHSSIIPSIPPQQKSPKKSSSRTITVHMYTHKTIKSSILNHVAVGWCFILKLTSSESPNPLIPIPSLTSTTWPPFLSHHLCTECTTSQVKEQTLSSSSPKDYATSFPSIIFIDPCTHRLVVSRIQSLPTWTKDPGLVEKEKPMYIPAKKK